MNSKIMNVNELIKIFFCLIGVDNKLQKLFWRMNFLVILKKTKWKR